MGAIVTPPELGDSSVSASARFLHVNASEAVLFVIKLEMRHWEVNLRVNGVVILLILCS